MPPAGPPPARAADRSGPEPAGRVRLFVALEMGVAARDELAAWAARTLPSELRLVPAADLHVTLCFLGERARSDAVPIAAAVATAIAGTAPIEIAFGETLWLPPRRPRILAVAVTPSKTVLFRDRDPRALGVLQSRVAAALAAGGFVVPERRRFLAHVTVARIPGGGSRSGMAGGLAFATPEGRFEAGEVTLIRSHFGAAPARYERLAVFALSPAR